MSAADTLRAPRAADFAISMVTALIAISALLLIRELLVYVPEEVPMVPAVSTAEWWSVFALILVQCLSLSWARHAPRTVVLFVSVCVLAFALLSPGTAFDILTFGVPVSAFFAFRVAPSRGLWAVTVVALLVVTAASVLNSIRTQESDVLTGLGEAALQSVSLYGIALLLAFLIRARSDSRASQRRELRALTRERDALVNAAVARERTAMARELHDIAAHHLSGIALMAAATERQVAGDPDAARESARQIRRESTAVLQNLRRVVGLLRDEGTAERSVETFASVPELVDGMAADRGAEVQLRVLHADEDGPVGSGVGPLAQLAAYRTIQESLANAAMHAPGAACIVEIDDTAADEVRVLVRNEPPNPNPAAAAPNASAAPGHRGFGLVGMRERADLVGAELRYGRTRDGGWEVLLNVPREVARGQQGREGWTT